MQPNPGQWNLTICIAASFHWILFWFRASWISGGLRPNSLHQNLLQPFGYNQTLTGHPAAGCTSILGEPSRIILVSVTGVSQTWFL
jgi:hypothetical protein